MDEKIKQKLIKASIISSIGCSPLFLGIIATFLAVFFVLGLFDSQTDASSSSWSTSTNGECGFTLTTTSLTQKEYKEKVTEYAKTNSNFQIFANNADSIYSLAKKMKLNPELVVVRAYVEGNGTVTGANNYWGLNCTNTGGLSACYSYSSFEEGYTAYLNNISRYETLTSMMRSYAYIGANWYTELRSDIGGCYYAPYIYGDNMPARVKKACSSSAPYCGIDGGSGCTATTDEDQEAYANWQVEKMNEVRKKIFGITDEDDAKACENISSTSMGSDEYAPNWSNHQAWLAGGLNPYANFSQPLYGQCTWFAWGKMYEIYEYPFKFDSNGSECVGQLLANHGDVFKSSNIPVAGGLFSIGGTCNHVGVILGYDSSTGVMTYIDGNYNGTTDSFEVAKTDWRQRAETLEQLKANYSSAGCSPVVSFAAPIGGVDAVRKKLHGG